MRDLGEIRQTIDALDKEIARLFEERMKAASEVAAYKAEHNLPVLDAGREKAIIERNSAYIKDADICSYYILFQKQIMALSRSYQRALVSGKRVAYCGVEGAYANIAARKIFGNAEYVPSGSFDKAYSAVESGECDCAVLPIENSIAGEVGGNLDMIYEGNLFINGVYELKICHNLLAKKGTVLSEIREVVSHPQALEQCAVFIQNNGFRSQNAVNTAMAAKAVAESEDRSIAAIASIETAELYGLEVISGAINDNPANTTRFAVLSRVANSPDHENDKLFTLGFSVKHEAGALAKAINILGEHGFNMRSIKSRALRNQLWQYYFYIEVEGHAESEAGRKMLRELSGICENVKVLGVYREHISLEG